MRNSLLGINAGLAALGAAFMTFYTIRRKKFQDFVPILTGIAVYALIVAADMAFFIITDNM